MLITEISNIVIFIFIRFNEWMNNIRNGIDFNSSILQFRKYFKIFHFIPCSFRFKSLMKMAIVNAQRLISNC